MTCIRELRLLAALATVLASACRPDDGDPYAGTPAIEGDTLLRFPSGATYVSGLRSSLAYIGRIPDATGGPFVLMSGVECESCDADLSVLLRSVRDPAFTPSEARVTGSYAYPGRIVHFEGNMPLMESRLFWGRCLAGRGPGVVQFATEFDSTGKRVRDLVRISEIRQGRLVDDSILTSPPTPSAVQSAVRVAACREVPPKAQHGGL